MDFSTARGSLGFIVISIGILFFYHVSTAYSAWEGTLDKKTFDNFVEDYKVHPEALIKNADILKTISSDQLHETVVSLGLTHFTYMFPVQIKGEELPNYKGKALSDLSIMAIKGGQLVPIPFQFDEYDKTGLIYIKNVSRNAPQGTPGELDEDDELVFMFRDAGTDRYTIPEVSADGYKILSEIKLDTPEHTPRYAYLVEGNPKRSEADYVSTDLKQGLIATTLFEITFNPKNIVKDLNVSPKCGPNCGQNVIDSFYVKMSTGILNENLRFELNSQDNIQAIPVGVKDGPIRSSVLFKGRLWYFGMPTPFTEYVNVNFYEQAFNIPSRFSLDSLNAVKYFINFIKRPNIEVSLDLYNLKGAKFTFENVYKSEHPEMMGVVNNQICDFEREIQRSRLPGKWVYFDSNQGWNFFFSNQMHIEPGGLFDKYLDGMKICFIYEDNLLSRRDYEKYPGAEPRLGATVEGIPEQALNIMPVLRKINLSKIKNIGELIFEMDRAGAKGAFKKFDKTADKLILSLKNEGKIQTKEDLMELFISDLKTINISGVPRETFISLLRKSMQAEISEDLVPMNHYNLIHKMIEIAKEENIHLEELRYVAMDSTLWLPDTIGPGGPENFYKEVLHPPKSTISPYADAIYSIND